MSALCNRTHRASESGDRHGLKERLCFTHIWSWHHCSRRRNSSPELSAEIGVLGACQGRVLRELLSIFRENALRVPIEAGLRHTGARKSLL